MTVDVASKLFPLDEERKVHRSLSTLLHSQFHPTKRKVRLMQFNMSSLHFGDFADSPSMILSPHQHQHSFEPVSSYTSSVQRYHSFKPFKPIDSVQNPLFRFEKMADQQPNPTPTGIKRKRDSFEGEPNMPFPQRPNPALSNTSQAHAPPYILPDTEDLLAQFTETASSSSEPAESSRHKLPRRSTADTHSLTTTGPNNTIVSTTPNPITTSPHIDQLSQLLGIGWTAVLTNPDPDFQKAVRGWEKYIDNHYPLDEVAIQARSKGLDNAFLVVARNQENLALRRWYLFREDLLVGLLSSLPHLF